MATNEMTIQEARKAQAKSKRANVRRRWLTRREGETVSKCKPWVCLKCGKTGELRGEVDGVMIYRCNACGRQWVADIPPEWVARVKGRENQ